MSDLSRWADVIARQGEMRGAEPDPEGGAAPPSGRLTIPGDVMREAMAAVFAMAREDTVDAKANVRIVARAMIALLERRGHPVSPHPPGAERLPDAADSVAGNRGAPLFYACDEGGDWPYPTLSDAVAHIEQQLAEARASCDLGDPEWPSGIGDLAVYECASVTDEPREVGRLVARAVATDVPDADAGEGEPVACEYRITGA